MKKKRKRLSDLEYERKRKICVAVKNRPSVKYVQRINVRHEPTIILRNPCRGYSPNDLILINSMADELLRLLGQSNE